MQYSLAQFTVPHFLEFRKLLPFPLETSNIVYIHKLTTTFFKSQTELSIITIFLLCYKIQNEKN